MVKLSYPNDFTLTIAYSEVIIPWYIHYDNRLVMIGCLFEFFSVRLGLRQINQLINTKQIIFIKHFL